MAFFEDVLGLKKGERPGFGDDGAWIYVGDIPQIHLSFVDEENAQAQSTDSSPIDHVAFEASGLREFEQKLAKLNVPVQKRQFREFGFTQLNVHDPNGVKIEIQFKEVVDEERTQ